MCAKWRGKNTPLRLSFFRLFHQAPMPDPLHAKKTLCTRVALQQRSTSTISNRSRSNGLVAQGESDGQVYFQEGNPVCSLLERGFGMPGPKVLSIAISLQVQILDSQGGIELQGRCLQALLPEGRERQGDANLWPVCLCKGSYDGLIQGGGRCSY